MISRRGSLLWMLGSSEAGSPETRSASGVPLAGLAANHALSPLAGGARAGGRDHAPSAALNRAADKRSPFLPAAPDLRASGAAPAAAAHDPALRRVPGERGELRGALGAPRDGGARCRGVP